MIDGFGVLDPDLNLEPDVLNDDECGDVSIQDDGLSRDTANREENEDRDADEGEACFEDSLRASWDGLVRVHRQTVMVVFHHPGQPAIAQRMRWIPWEGRR